MSAGVQYLQTALQIYSMNALFIIFLFCFWIIGHWILIPLSILVVYNIYLASVCTSDRGKESSNDRQNNKKPVQLSAACCAF